MKITLAGLAMALVLAGTTTMGWADSACSDKVAAKAAAGGSCASACSADKVANAQAEQLGIAKGGAAEDAVKGYGLDKQVPDFKLNDANGKTVSLSDYSGKPVVLVFYNQACPFVVEVKDRLNEFTKTYSEKGVGVLAIDAGINNSEEDLKKEAASVTFPILVNRDSDLAKKFNAKRTPEVFILDKSHKVVYTGAFDNGEQGAAAGARKSYAADAVEAILKGASPEVTQTKAFGCSIKFAKAEGKAKGEKKEKAHSHKSGEKHSY